MLTNNLQHGIKSQLHGVGEGHIGQFIHHHEEEFSNSSLIVIAALLQGKQHKGNEYSNLVQSQTYESITLYVHRLKDGEP